MKKNYLKIACLMTLLVPVVCLGFLAFTPASPSHEASFQSADLQSADLQSADLQSAGFPSAHVLSLDRALAPVQEQSRSGPFWGGGGLLLGLGLALAVALAAVSPAVRDAALKLTKALPAEAGATVTSGAIDTGTTSSGMQPGEVELLLSAPAQATTALPDGKTLTYNIIMSAAADLSGPVTLIAGAIVQTGAGGAGAAAKEYRFRLPSTALRYIAFTAVAGALTGDLSAKSGTLEVLV